jgi:hypothetical protein
MKLMNDLEIIYLMRNELSEEDFVTKIEKLVFDFRNTYQSILEND